MKLPALYSIADQYLADIDALADLDMPPEVVQDTLEGLQGDMEAKALSVAAFIRNLESSATQIKAAETAMSNRRKALEHRADQIREYLLYNMERTGISKIEAPWFVIALKKNPPTVVIDDASLIPLHYMLQPPAPPPSPDKKEIAAAIKFGEIVPGAHLETKMRVDIK